jgi:transposase
MTEKDARRISCEAQEEPRLRVTRALKEGMTITEASKAFGVSRMSIHTWKRAYEKGGKRALKSKKRGRPKGIRLRPHQAATTVRIIKDRCPEQLKLPFALWTRDAVRDLIRRRFGVDVSVWTVGRYLKRWGFTPQKPLRRAYERNPVLVKRWLEEEYPEIRKKAKKEGAEIYWGDEMGLRSDYQAGRSYAPRGKPPVIPGTGQRFGCNMVSAITNRGSLSFMVFRERFTSKVMVKFLRRLIRNTDRKVYLILDGHPVHRSVKVRNWISNHSDRINLFFLPPYAPTLNPDEYLNNDVKGNALGRQRPNCLWEMMTAVRSYLKSVQMFPMKVRSYFRAKDVRYALD